MTKEEFAHRLTEIFPEKAAALAAHYDTYGELLGHVFFSEEINVPLFDLLIRNRNRDCDCETIGRYCGFVQEMWRCGTADVVNIVDVTILERLSDDNTVWHHFGSYISDEFKTYINKVLLRENLMMTSVPELT